MTLRRRLTAALTAVALAATTLAVLVQPSPVAAAAPTRILNTSTGGGLPSWLETHSLADGGSGQRITVTFLAEHAAGRRITQVFVDNGITGNDSTINVTSEAYPTPTTNGLETSRVTLTFNPGRSGSFSCPVFGGATRRVSRSMGFRVRDNTGQQSQLVSFNDVTQIENGDCFGRTDYPHLRDQIQSATTALPGQNVTFLFRADDPDNTGTNDHFDRFRWRLRRLNDGFTTGLTTVNPPGSNDNELISLDVSFPSRGRWVVEADLGGEDGFGQSGGDFFRLGAVDVNDSAATLSPSLAFSGGGVVAGSPPSVNQGSTANAVLTATDGGTGGVQVAEWDADGNGSYERREYTVPSAGAISHPALTTGQRTQSVNTTTHGVKTVGVQVIDNGALDAADNIRRTASTTGQIRVNAIPTATSFSTSTAEDTATSFNLMGADADNQPAPLSYTVLSGGPSNGDLNCTGAACTYTPDQDFHGTDSFTYRVADGPVANAAWATSNTATVNITVTPVNDAPVADGQQVSTDEDTALPITLSGSDVDGDPLGFDIVSGPTNGDLTGSGANRTYTPDPNFHGADSFVFSAADSGGLSGTATVDITVNPVNDAPVAVDQALTTDEDTPLNLSLVATDVDGDNLTFSADQPANGSVACTGTACTYTPDPDFNGADAFTFEVGDGNGGSDSGEIAITVDPVNDAPVAIAQMVELDEDTPIDVTLEANDVDLDPLTFNVIAGPDNGTTTPVGGAVVNYAPDLNYHGADEFTFEADDGALSDTALVALTINPVNDAPVVGDQAFSTDEDTPVVLSIAASDVDGDTLSWSHGTPANGTIVGALPDVAYLPDADFHGTDSFTVTVDDGNGGLDTATITVEIAPVNDAPVAVATAVTTDEDVPVAVDLTATDVDNAPSALTYTVLEGPSQGTLDCPGDGPACTYTPDADVNGSDLVVFEVSDGDLADTASVSITISAVNDPPETDDITVATDEDVPVGITLGATDVDGDPLTFAISSPPSSGALSGDAPSVLYTPNLNANGSDSFDFVVSDGTTDVAGTVLITVEPVNDAPVAQPVSGGTTEDTPVTFTLAATDVDNNAADLTFSIPDPPAQGLVECSGSTGAACEFMPADDFHGTVQFTYEVSDGDLSGSSVVTIAVASQNDPPTADDQLVQTDEDTPVNIELTGADVDGDALTYAVSSPPATGSLSGTAPNVLYTPAAEWSGSDSFTFTVSDGELTDTATVTVEVAAVNDAPVAHPLAVDVGEDEAQAFQMDASDVDGDALTFAVESGPAHGDVTCDTGGACTYTPDPDYHGTDELTFSATDPSGASATATVTIVVHAAPMIHTTLAAQPVLLHLHPVFNATLTRTDTGEPLAGRTVRFVAGGSLRCTAVTDSNGLAQCGAPLLDLVALVNFGYDAHFDGDADFSDGHGHGPLVKIGRLLWLF